MKKKLLALAFAGAFVAQAAMADTANVNIYGVASLSYDATSTGSSAAGVASTNQSKVSSNSSRIGFKGSEDLGGGTSAIWQIESLIGMDGTQNAAQSIAAVTSATISATGAPAQTVAAQNNNVLGSRNTFVGLSGESWGTVLLGRNDTPYKTSTRRLDLFADTIADNRTLMGRGAGLGFDNRNANVVQYDSPNLSGFKISAQYTAGAEAATASGAVKGQTTSLAGMYEAGPAYVTLAYQTNNFGSAGTGDLAGTAASANQSERAWKLGGSYSMDAFQVNAVYEQTTDGLNAGAAVGDHKAYYLAGKFNVSGNDAVKLAYTKSKEVGSPATANTGANQVAIGYDHSMSKRTTVYALYTRLSNDTAAAYSLSSAAVATGAVAPSGADADPTAFSIGIKHTF